MHLWGNPLSELAPSLLPSITPHLEDLDLGYTNLTTPQLIPLLTALNHHRRLKKLDLPGVNLSGVEGGLLAGVVAQAEELDLTEANLTTPQLVLLLTALHHHRRLKKFSLYSVDLSGVEGGLLAGVVAQVEEVELGGTNLSIQQVLILLLLLHLYMHLLLHHPLLRLLLILLLSVHNPSGRYNFSFPKSLASLRQV